MHGWSSATEHAEFNLSALKGTKLHPYTPKLKPEPDWQIYKSIGRHMPRLERLGTCVWALQLPG